jgi:hypothetical protein
MLIIIVVILFFIKYYIDSKRYITIYNLFPSQKDIDNFNYFKYSRVSIKGKNTIVLNVTGNDIYLMKEHTERNNKIKLHTCMRIKSFIQRSLKSKLGHVRYKPGSSEYYCLKYKFNLIKNKSF